MNYFKKLNPQRKMKRASNQNPRYDLDFNNYKNEKEKINNLQNFFFNFILKINNSNFNKFCKKYRALINSEIVSFFIKEFLVVNRVQYAHFKILKADALDEKINFDKNINEKIFKNNNYFNAPQDLERINNLTINLNNTSLNKILTLIVVIFFAKNILIFYTILMNLFTKILEIIIVKLK
jgi:hypothetical protein